MKEKIKKTYEIIKSNQRYFWVLLVFVFIFLINRSFPAEKITSESCADGKCKTSIAEPSLSNANPSFYLNNALNSAPKEYYRLIFEVRSNQKTNLDIFITNAFDQDKKISNLQIEKPNTNIIQEVIFKSDGAYSDLLFKKTSATDGADAYIDQITLSKLNITSDQEMAKLEPTITGGADITVEDQAQNKNDYSFEQLKDPDLVFGQLFIPKTNFITGVSLDIDVVKQSNLGGKKYVLELREVNMDSDIPEIKSNPLSAIGFSANGIEQYRQEDGKFLFPLLARLEPGKTYFIGINNSKVDVDKFNYLILKGTKDQDSYPNGQLAIKYNSKSYLAVGNLYFKTYGFELKKYNGISVLPSSIIEDMGNRRIFFSYQTPKDSSELINFDSFSNDIYFDSGTNALRGMINEKKPSFAIYKFNTIFPFKDFSLSASQGNVSWNKLKISYSFDKQAWQEVSSSEKNNIQFFDFYQGSIPANQKEIYIKIEPEKDKYPQEVEFGIKDFKFKAELIKKN